MKINSKQLTALRIGIGATCALMLFPPQIMMPDFRRLFSMPTDVGSAPVAPSTAPYPQMHIIRYSFLFAPASGSVAIDWLRLLVSIAIVAVITLGALFTLQTHDGK